MSAKFRSRKKQAEAVVDDWEASEEEEEKEEVLSNIKPTSMIASSSTSSTVERLHQDAWEETMGESSNAPNKAIDGRTIWQEANRDAPQPQPLLVNRSLPSTVLNPRLYSSSKSPLGIGGDYQLTGTAPPPPQILRREKVQRSLNANDNGNEKKKSLKEREEEYKRARERIFGSASSLKSSSSVETTSQHQRIGTSSLDANSTRSSHPRTKS